jgi:hypothetical protein
MRRFFLHLANELDPDSFAARRRRKRFTHFLRLMERVRRQSLNILDVGGVEQFWEIMGLSDSPHRITLLNLDKVECKHRNISSVAGDGRDLSQFSDRQFDIVLSNSVIEHVGSLEDQSTMAKELLRVGERVFVQTPNFFFPFEPHFLVPFFHWFPRSARIWLVRHFSLGWYEKTPDSEAAARFVDEIRLMRYSELRSFFPGANIIRERFLGLTKSFLIVKG